MYKKLKKEFKKILYKAFIDFPIKPTIEVTKDPYDRTYVVICVDFLRKDKRGSMSARLDSDGLHFNCITLYDGMGSDEELRIFNEKMDQMESMALERRLFNVSKRQ